MPLYSFVFVCNDLAWHACRTKLKQTEVDCERLKRCCDCLALENRRLQKELHELKAVKAVACISSAPAAGRGGGTRMSQQQQQLDYSSYSRPLLPAASTLTMCPSCERVSTVADNRAAHTSNNFTKPAPAPAFSPHLVQSSAACSWQLLLFLSFSSSSWYPTTLDIVSH